MTGYFDNDTAARIDLTADLNHPSVAHEWLLWLEVLPDCVINGILSANTVRALAPTIKDQVHHKRLSAFYPKAAAPSRGVLTPIKKVENKDIKGGNSGHDITEYRFNRDAWERALVEAGGTIPPAEPFLW